MRQLRTDVSVELSIRQAVEIVGKALPVPRQAFGQNREGDILHAFHQTNEAIMIFRLARSESDAAISHHHCRDAVQG